MLSELLRIPRYDYEEIYRRSNQRRIAKHRRRTQRRQRNPLHRSH